MNASAHRVQRCHISPLGSGVISNYKPLDVSAGNRINSLGRALWLLTTEISLFSPLMLFLKLFYFISLLTWIQICVFYL